MQLNGNFFYTGVIQPLCLFKTDTDSQAEAKVLIVQVDASQR